MSETAVERRLREIGGALRGGEVMKERALEGLFHPLQECVWAGASAMEIKMAVAKIYAQIMRDEAEAGEKLLRGES